MSRVRVTLVQLTLVLILIFLSSCKHDDNPVGIASNPAVIMPLRVGNAWEFLITSYDTSGAVVNSATDSMVIVRDSLIGTERWYMDQYGELMIDRSDGMWLSTGASHGLFLKYPAHAGDRYSYGGDSATPSLFTMHVVSTQTAVSVPEGLHMCYEYQAIPEFASTMEIRYYVSPSYGLIKTEVNGLAPNGRWYLSSRRALTHLRIG